MVPLVSSPVGFSTNSVCGAPDKAPLLDLEILVHEELAPLIMHGEAVHAGTSIA